MEKKMPLAVCLLLLMLALIGCDAPCAKEQQQLATCQKESQKARAIAQEVKPALEELERLRGELEELEQQYRDLKLECGQRQERDKGK